MSLDAIRCAVLTVSDRCSRGEAEDRSGPAVVRVCEEVLGAEVVCARCVSDDAGEIEGVLREWVSIAPAVDLVLTTGGTGLSSRDNTPEAAGRVIERAHSGLMELARLRCLEKTPLTFLSRGVAGSAGGTLIVTLPGSERGALETLEAIVDVLPHAVKMLRDGGH